MTTLFTLSNIIAPAGATVVGRLYSPSGSVIATVTLSLNAPSTTNYSGSVEINPTPPDSEVETPYTFDCIATVGWQATTIWAAGTIYGWLQNGEWFKVSDQVALTPLSKVSVVSPSVDWTDNDPSSGPITFQMVSDHLRLDDASEMDLIGLYIAAAVDFAEESLQISLVAKTITAIFNAEDVELSPPVMDYPWDPLSSVGTPLGMPSFATWGTYNRSPVIKLPRGPVSSVLSVTDGAGAAITQFRLERTPIGDRLRFLGAALYPVTVTYRAGYPDSKSVPASIRVAILTHIATLFNQRESANAGNAKAVPHSLEAFYALKARRICGG